jgi:endonuclease/exonuclease/phosphatase family metal-dependent hydrolase
MFTRRHTLATLAIATATAAVVPATTQAATAQPDVTVMSRNLYLGADIIKLASATSLDDEMAKAAALHKDVDQTNFPVRAKAIAAEIKKQKPDIVGLQEVARFYKGADGVHDSTTNADVVLYDWLKILQTEIKKAGLSYKVVSDQTELDVEVPSAEGYDLRLKLGNAVLLKSGKGTTVKFKKAVSGTFKSQLSVPLKDQTVKLQRGYAGMDGVVGGKKFRFIDPHAEAYSDDAAKGQFEELLKTGAKNKKVTTIMAGDFNSDPTQQGANAGPYNTVIDGGFIDTGKFAKTCCQDELLDNTSSKLATWIDHIVARPKVKVLKSTVFGNKASDRIGDLWPSDHAGVVAKLRILK